MKSLQELEAELIVRYPAIIPGSMRDIDPDETSMYHNKRTVQINCATEGCNHKRRIATSDLHQVAHCESCIRTARLKRRRDARAAHAAQKAQNTADSIETTKKPKERASSGKKPTKSKPKVTETPVETVTAE